MESKKYLRIYETLKGQIIDHTYRYGDKLPSKRITAQDYDVSLVTVEHAFELLMEEDYIRSKEKSGYFVSYREGDFFTGAPFNSYTGTFSSSISKGESFSYDLYAKTIRKVLSVYGSQIMQKSPFGGHTILKNAISNYLKRSRNIKVLDSQIVIGSGAEYLYGLITQFIGKDIPYAMESPSYQQIQKVYVANGITPSLLPLGKDGIISDALWKSDAKFLHITPYRSFPSGITASASKKREYLRWAEEKDALLLEDDFESEFTPSRKTAETLYAINEETKLTERVIYVNTFTKTFSSSIRIAYMVIPYRLIDSFYSKLDFYACSVPTLEQYVLATLIDNGDFERHINRMRRRLRDV